jgi:hypothetical protein
MKGMKQLLLPLLLIQLLVVRWSSMTYFLLDDPKTLGQAFPVA